MTRVVSAMCGRLDAGEPSVVSREDCSYGVSTADPRRCRHEAAQDGIAVPSSASRGVVQLPSGKTHHNAPRNYVSRFVRRRRCLTGFRSAARTCRRRVPSLRYVPNCCFRLIRRIFVTATSQRDCTYFNERMNETTSS